MYVFVWFQTELDDPEFGVKKLERTVVDTRDTSTARLFDMLCESTLEQQLVLFNMLSRETVGGSLGVFNMPI